MHFSVIFLFFIIDLGIATASPKQESQFREQIRSLEKKWTSKTKIKQKIADLKILKSAFDKARSEYQKENPIKGSSDEEKFLSLYYGLEPVFNLIESKIDAQSCNIAQHKIELEDSYQDDGKLSTHAQISMDLTKNICK
jgi:hypothetical protein